MCVKIISISVKVAEWPSFGKEMLPRLTVSSLCIILGFGPDGRFFV